MILIYPSWLYDCVLCASEHDMPTNLAWPSTITVCSLLSAVRQ